MIFFCFTGFGFNSEAILKEALPNGPTVHSRQENLLAAVSNRLIRLYYFVLLDLMLGSLNENFIRSFMKIK